MLRVYGAVKTCDFFDKIHVFSTKFGPTRFTFEIASAVGIVSAQSNIFSANLHNFLHFLEKGMNK